MSPQQQTSVPTTSTISTNDDASIENTLDIEFSMGASGSNIYFYTYPNSVQGFFNAIQSAGSNSNVQVISISWGSSEFYYDNNTLTSFNNLFNSIVNNGKVICVASGDNGSTDGTGISSVDFPSSAQNVIACGGTTINYTGVDTVWNEGNNATGGGFSSFFSPPSRQSGLTYVLNNVTTSISHRAVPDIAMNGNPYTGYTLAIGGSIYINTIGGTSCVAPLFSGCLARLTNVTGVTNKLYTYGIQSGNTINPTYFTDIVSGNNGAYSATIGFDECSGLGTPNGQNLMSALNT